MKIITMTTSDCLQALKPFLNNNNLNSSLFDSSNSINDETETNPNQFTIQINQLPAGREHSKKINYFLASS
jgi:hypothetical protein